MRIKLRLRSISPPPLPLSFHRPAHFPTLMWSTSRTALPPTLPTQQTNPPPPSPAIPTTTTGWWPRHRSQHHPLPSIDQRKTTAWVRSQCLRQQIVAFVMAREITTDRAAGDIPYGGCMEKPILDDDAKNIHKILQVYKNIKNVCNNFF